MDITVKINEQAPTDQHLFLEIYVDGVLKRTITTQRGVESLPWFDPVFCAPFLVQNFLAENNLKGSEFGVQKTAVEAKTWKM